MLRRLRGSLCARKVLVEGARLTGAALAGNMLAVAKCRSRIQVDDVFVDVFEGVAALSKT